MTVRDVIEALRESPVWRRLTEGERREAVSYAIDCCRDTRMESIRCFILPSLDLQKKSG